VVNDGSAGVRHVSTCNGVAGLIAGVLTGVSCGGASTRVSCGGAVTRAADAFTLHPAFTGVTVDGRLPDFDPVDALRAAGFCLRGSVATSAVEGAAVELSATMGGTTRCSASAKKRALDGMIL